MNIADALKSFEVYDGEYKREQVDFAVEHQDEITPYLISILNDVANDPLKYVENEKYYSHIYAFILLGYFKESKAHKVILKLASYSAEMSHQLFGDVLSSDLPTVLFKTCGGSIERIKEFILNKEHAEYNRIAAVSSLLYAVAGGFASREEVLKFLGTQFTGDEVDRSSDYWGLVASHICDLTPDDETMEIIRHGYEAGLINPGVVGYEEFEESLKIGEARTLELLKEKMNREMPDDIHEYMSWWACFKDNKSDQEMKTNSGLNFPKRKKKKKVKNKDKGYTHKKKKKKRRK